MLVLVVGASGAGKDTLIDAARAALEGDGRFRFVSRVVTRPVIEGGEKHESVTEAEFDRRAEAGHLALQWRAHGLRYGLPGSIAADLKDGRVVVANVSRATIPQLAQRFRVHVVEVTAPPQLRASRLVARGREDADDLARRLARSILLPLPVERDTIENTGTVEEGARRLVAVLNRAAESALQD